LHQYLAGKTKKYDIEYRMLHQSGKIVWVHARGKVVAFDENTVPSRMIGTHSDITRRKRTEEMLHLSEEKFAAAFSGNPAAIVITRLEDGLFHDVNDTWLALTGYDREEIIGVKARKVHIWPSPQTYSRFAGELREKGFVRGWEQEFLKKSGERFVAQVSAQVLTVQGEKMVLATLVDITPRRRVEEELQFHKTILEETGKIAKVGGWRFDVRTGQGFWTEEVARIHDLDPAVPTCRDIGMQYYVGESREKIVNAVREAIDHGVPYDLELELVSAAGIRKWVRTIGHPVIRDGRVVELKGSFQDISDRIQAETALRDSEERFRSLVKMAPIPMGLVAADGTISFLNDRFTELLGYTLEDIPTIDNWWDLASPDSAYREQVAQGWKETLAHVARQGGFLETAEFNVIRRDGTARVVEISAIAVGESVLATFFDLTERKRAEIALRDSVKEKTALLNEVHHRVKNNLQIVSSLLGLQAGRTNNPQVIDILEDTRNRVKAMALLHETLYRSGNLARVDFTTYVKDLCGQLLISFGPTAKRVNLDFEMTHIALPLKQAIPCGLIVGELVSNALKHGFAGQRSGRICLRLDRGENRTLALGVRDEGVGLSKSFDPTGAATLGIQLVSRLAGQLGGHLEVKQPLDGGAYFKVVFPVPKDSILQDEP
jgi:PAS domain S-box-containing protein